MIVPHRSAPGARRLSLGALARPLALAAAALLLSGCATSLVFDSDIEGAKVSREDGELIGETPVTISLSNSALRAFRDASGCARVKGVSYLWPSGATARSADPITLCGGQSSYRVYLERPQDAPGAEEDLRYANALLKKREAELRQRLAAEQSVWFGFGWPGPFPLGPGPGPGPGPHGPPPRR